MDLRNGYPFIPKEKRKKILLMGDDLQAPSGVGSVSRQIVMATAHHFNWVQLACLIRHPQKGKILDISPMIEKETGLEDVYVKQYPFEGGYGNARILREIIQLEQPDCILHFTDPRQWIWLYQIEHEIRQKIPITYYNIWDNLPYPYYNKSYYQSSDLIMNISKQTHNLVKNVLGKNKYSDLDLNQKYHKDKTMVSYVPHGINDKEFHPMDMDKQYLLYDTVYDDIFGDNQYDFVVFYNNRNIRRKRTSDVILAFKEFIDKLTPEKRDKCALLLHTEVMDQNGTNLEIVKDMIAPDDNIIITNRKIPPKELNVLYNIADVTINIAFAEGFGLSNAESMMTGTMTVTAVTGGLQDQLRFTDEDGKWINFDTDFSSNHMGTYKKHGEWVIPVYPVARNLAGSIPTPYIFEDLVNTSDVAEAFHKVYMLSKKHREERGMKGREWVLGDESMMSADKMGENIMKNLGFILDRHKPREKYTIHKFELEINNKPTGIML